MSWLLLLSLSAYAQVLEPIIIESSKNETLNKDSHSPVYILDEKKLRNSNPYVHDEIKKVTGVDLVQNGSYSGNTSIFVRGLDSKYTAIYLNGIKLNDTVDPNRRVDINFINSLDIEKIEYIKGSQSVLYGSDALGGIINIITKTQYNQGHYKLNVGSYGFVQNQVSQSGSQSRSAYQFGMLAGSANGISATTKQFGGNERDGFEQQEGYFIFENHFTDSLLWKTFVRASHAISEIDEGFGASRDDANRELTKNDYQLATSLEKKFSDDQKWSLHLNSQGQRRVDTDEIDVADVTKNVDTFKGYYHQLESRWMTKNRSVLGLSLENEQAETDDFLKQDKSTSAVFYQQSLQFERHHFEGGVRVLYHETFHDYAVYNLGYKFQYSENLKFGSRYGTSFKAPSLYELYSSFGDENLNPEKGETVDAYAHLTTKVSQHQLTYFYSEIEQQIQFVVANYQNVDAIQRAQGVELENSLTLADSWSSYWNYTYTDVELNSGRALRRPHQKHNLGIEYHHERWRTGIEWLYRSKRRDSDFPATVVLPSYSLYNLYAGYKFKQQEYLLELKNIFDKEYESAFGYTAMPFTVYLSTRWNF
ncbi:MAG: TonB-dependent receptor [Bacteriovoracaceae bacterium]|nr:TonB-dependent receptor [Bacteriovoracaceae bacterium]